jgi:hypothetical protein
MSTTKTQSKEYPSVNYNINLLEVCKSYVEGSWKNDITLNRYMFAVAGENKMCEYGEGLTLKKAFAVSEGNEVKQKSLYDELRTKQLDQME